MIEQTRLSPINEKVADEYRQHLRSQEARYATMLKDATPDSFIAISARRQQVLYDKSVFEQLVEGKKLEDIS